jgi:hypothetical protein
MPKSPKERKESTKREREEGRTSKEATQNTAGIREGEQSTKKGISGSERRGERKRREMADGGSKLDEKDENDRGKDGTKRKEGGRILL